MEKIAILLTVYNRVEKTIKCLTSLLNSGYKNHNLSLDIFLTDDGSTDNSANILKQEFPNTTLYILQGDGNLFWNAGMINSWNAALKQDKYDGYLWLNNDTIVLPNLWDELIAAEEHSMKTFGSKGIYVGSTFDLNTKKFTYGGFNFTSKWTLKDRFLIPNGSFQNCQCGHGNVTFVSHDVVEKIGILDSRYIHGGGDHDYTYMAYKKGIPLFILRDFVGACENDHKKDGFYDFMQMNITQRFKYLKSPIGYNLHNTLLFQKRFFQYRYPFVLFSSLFKVLFPKFYYNLYKMARK